MTKHTAGILGSLTTEALRAMTDAALEAKATALENTSDDGFLSVADEADLCLVNREQERREAAQAVAPTWYLATCRVRTANREAVVLLVEARSGDEVDAEIGRHGIDARTHDISWSPLSACVYGKAGIVDDLIIVPAVPR